METNEQEVLIAEATLYRALAEFDLEEYRGSTPAEALRRVAEHLRWLSVRRQLAADEAGKGD